MITAVLGFLDPLTNKFERGRIDFCSVQCKDQFVEIVERQHNKKLTGLIEKFCAEKTNEDGDCPQCYKPIMRKAV